jgi:hypothetical protein
MTVPEKRWSRETARNIRAEVSRLPESRDGMTVRQVFDHMPAAGVVANTERDYAQVQRQVLAMRREGTLAWEFIRGASLACLTCGKPLVGEEEP